MDRTEEKRKLQDLTENQVVQTTNENDLQFRELLDKEGFKRSDGSSYLSDRRENQGLGEDVCYWVFGGEFDDVSFCYKEGYEILQASEFLTPKIKKSELLNRIEVLEKKVAELEEIAKVTIENEVENSKCVKLDKPQFEVGKVYKDGSVMFYCTRVNDGKPFGFGFALDGNWYEDDDNYWDRNFTEATSEEWFERLKKEYYRLGYKKGVTIKSQDRPPSKIIGDPYWASGSKLISVETEIVKGQGNQFYPVMKGGKWSEIVEVEILQFEVGEVYTGSHNMFVYCTKVKDGKIYGFGTDAAGDWQENDYQFDNYWDISGKATKEDWKEVVLNLAYNRGYHKMVKDFIRFEFQSNHSVLVIVTGTTDNQCYIPIMSKGRWLFRYTLEWCNEK